MVRDERWIESGPGEKGSVCVGFFFLGGRVCLFQERAVRAPLLFHLIEQTVPRRKDVTSQNQVLRPGCAVQCGMSVLCRMYRTLHHMPVCTWVCWF
jgi:hypothetical protein